MENNNDKKIAKSFRLDPLDVKKLEDGQNLWDIKERNLTGKKHSLVECLSEAIGMWYESMSESSIDAQSSDKYSRMIENKIKTKTNNLENMMATISWQQLKDHKLLDLMVSLVFPNIIEKAISKLSAEMFNGDSKKANDYIFNEYIPSILNEESKYSQIIDSYLCVLESKHKDDI